MTVDEWRELYRREIRRGARLRLLEECPQSPDAAAMRLRRQLADGRYQSQGGQELDTFIRGWVNLSMLDMGRGTVRRNARTEREVDRILDDWQLELAEDYGPEGLAVLEDEFYNMILLYIALSKDDQKYARTLFGFKAMEQDALIRKLAADIRHRAIEIPEELELEERLEPLRKGAEAAFYDACRRELSEM